MSDMATWWDVANSEIAKSLLGSALGAFAGAWTAQFIAERSKNDADNLKEFRAANVAATIAFGVTDAILNLKQQLTAPLIAQYEAGKSEFLLHLEYGCRNEIYEFHADLQEIPPIDVPIAQLQKIVLEDITAPTRAIALTNVVFRMGLLLNKSIGDRNALTEEFRQNGVDPGQFYGLRTRQGGDLRYLNSLEGIGVYCDSLIHFSKMLGNDLVVYGKSVKSRLPKRLRRQAKGVTSVNFSKSADMLPDPAQFQSWEESFIESKKQSGFGLESIFRGRKHKDNRGTSGANSA